MLKKVFFAFVLHAATYHIGNAQETLTLQAAIETAVSNYGSIKAKEAYYLASRENIEVARRTNLPNFNVGLNQVYGSVNGQVGPMYGFGGLGVASSGLPLPEQNWNSGFGALYLANINWEVFTFGKLKQRIKVAESLAHKDNEDTNQEVFQHKIKVAAAYLNLLAAKKLTQSFLKNVVRTNTVKQTVENKAKNGLLPEVEYAMAKAEYANAEILLLRAKDTEQEQENKLSQLLGIAPTSLNPDTSLLARIPLALIGNVNLNHPQLSFLKSRIDVSEQQKHFLKTQYYPSFSLVGVFQTRGSGFGSSYASNQKDYTGDYFTGITPTRSNYLLGIGVNWNFTQTYRLAKQVTSQELISKGLQHEYELAEQQLLAQLQLSDTKWKNAMSIYEQTPVQLQAANDAYVQRSALYKNGLADLVDLSQAIYALVRAETDRDIAITNLWNALLLKAAASGDFAIFSNEL